MVSLITTQIVMDLSKDAGLRTSTSGSLKLSNFSVRNGAVFSSMFALALVPRQGHMRKNSSSKLREGTKHSRSSWQNLIWPTSRTTASYLIQMMKRRRRTRALITQSCLEPLLLGLRSKRSPKSSSNPCQTQLGLTPKTIITLQLSQLPLLITT